MPLWGLGHFAEGALRLVGNCGHQGGDSAGALGGLAAYAHRVSDLIMGAGFGGYEDGDIDPPEFAGKAGDS